MARGLSVAIQTFLHRVDHSAGMAPQPKFVFGRYIQRWRSR